MFSEKWYRCALSFGHVQSLWHRLDLFICFPTEPEGEKAFRDASVLARELVEVLGDLEANLDELRQECVQVADLLGRQRQQASTNKS